jgi:hypothetical protein
MSIASSGGKPASIRTFSYTLRLIIEMVSAFIGLAPEVICRNEQVISSY